MFLKQLIIDVYHDLQPENALIVFNDGQECLKLADFGISRVVDQGRNTCVTGKAGLLTLFLYY